ncbi:hypothetical protein P9112_012996 [Eukaryota sp. TZLM1-RC]
MWISISLVDVTTSLVLVLTGAISFYVIQKLVLHLTNQHTSTIAPDLSQYPPDEQLKMVFVVRTDLKMGKGKIAAQCCHACVPLWERIKGTPLEQQYSKFGHAKVVLRTDNEEEILKLGAKAQDLQLPYYIVRDAGRTQIEAGSITVIGMGPAPYGLFSDLVGHLKLL